MENNNVLIDKWELSKSGQYTNRTAIFSTTKKIAVIEHYIDNDEARKETESLILTSVNACKEVNPANPLAVAEQILNLYEAAKEALNLFDNYPDIHECIGTFEVLNKAVNGCLKGYFNKQQ